jgi:non-specific serine/threonine protein kinase
MFSGDLAVDRGQYERAAELYRTALRHFQRVDFGPWVHLVIQRIGIMAIRMGDHRRGVRILSTRHDADVMAFASMFPELAYERRRALDRARLVLGEESFSAETATGQTLALEDSVLEAVKATAVEDTATAANAPLTPRQHEVASLIARGLTNSQIAEQLVVSPHTVERHVENILDKLNVSSRTEVAVWVVERGRG